ncbi:hypothetical protein V501_01179 [Pseudogymnoascus sp. VKM F-4519 (FW-2642)]|nr:hypothetical protein V501_01179 [Pseudogymnoascus sp. VKM F-4519 (FW-2642)]
MALANCSRAANFTLVDQAPWGSLICSGSFGLVIQAHGAREFASCTTTSGHQGPMEPNMGGEKFGNYERRESESPWGLIPEGWKFEAPWGLTGKCELRNHKVGNPKPHWASKQN